VEAIVEVCVG